MPTLREVWHAVFPAARAIGGEGAALDRPVAWVRVLKPRVPGFDALEVSDLAIVPFATLDSLTGLGADTESVMRELAAAGASGVLLVGETGDDDARARATDSAQRFELAGFLLPQGDPTTLERSAIGYIVAGRAELERRVAGLEDELERAALAGVGLQGLSSIVARFLGRPVAVEGAHQALLAVHAPAEADHNFHLNANLAEYLQHRRGAVLREPLPAPRAGINRRGAGRPALVLLGAEPATELDRLVAQRIRLLLSLELERALPPDRASAGQAESLPSAGPPWAVLVARQHDVGNTTTLEQRERLRRDLAGSEPAARLVLRGDASSLELRVVAATEPEDPRAMRVGRRLAARLGRPVAISRPFDTPAERAAMEAEARRTLEAVEALPMAEADALRGPDGVLVAPSELAPAYRLIAGLSTIPDGQREARALLAPVLVGPTRRDQAVLATLRAVLDHAGVAEAAAALGIHRNTLAYRLHRIEARTGWRLSDPALRLALSVAIRLVQSAQYPLPESPTVGRPVDPRAGYTAFVVPQARRGLRHVPRRY